jgi:hypothetical protein
VVIGDPDFGSRERMQSIWDIEASLKIRQRAGPVSNTRNGSLIFQGDGAFHVF